MSQPPILVDGRRRQSYRAYSSWMEMRKRCINPKCRIYRYYGGRGISVCDRWNSFEAFLSDMGERPTPQHSLDRRNNDGNYEPGNCRWATKSEQAFNRRRPKLTYDDAREVHRLIAEGVSQTEIAKRFEVNQSTISFIKTGRLWREVYEGVR